MLQRLTFCLRSAPVTMRVALLVAALGGTGALAQAAAVVYVDATAPPRGNGRSWATAFCCLQNALAAGPSEIRIAQGVYRPNESDGANWPSTEAVFRVPGGTTLLGGFAGRNAAEPDARDVDASPTVLSGDLQGTGLPPGEYTANSLQVIVVEQASTSSPVRIDGLTLTGARYSALSCALADGLWVSECRFQGNRGALYAADSAVTLSNCSFTNNVERFEEHTGKTFPVIYSERSHLVLSGCAITNNTSRQAVIACDQGGLQMSGCTVSGNRSKASGFSTSGCDVQLRQCLFEKNQAGGESQSPWIVPPPQSGGTFKVVKGQVTIEECRFISNRTTGDGGAVSLDSTLLAAISNCDFSGNSASQGAAGYIQNSDPVFTGCRFDSNSATGSIKGSPSYGGAVTNTGNPTFIDCVFVRNTTTGHGGALYCFGALTLSNCIFKGNSASWGHAISGYGTATLTHCLVTQNENPLYPGRLGAIEWGYDSQIVAYNSIIWNGPLASYLPLSATHCCIQDETPGDGVVYPGTGNIDAFPRFALGDDFHLLHNSPCIDAGGLEVPGGLPATDLDGNPRVIDGDPDNPPPPPPPGKRQKGQPEPANLTQAGALPDIGPYEFNPERPSLAVGGDLELFFPHGSQPAPVPLRVRNCGGGKLQWTITGAADWLTVRPASGTTVPPKTSEVTLAFDLAGLEPGTRTCDLTIESANAANAPRVVTVTIHVTAPYHVPWTHATIQQAIDAAPPGSTVIVADGVYNGLGNRDLDLRGKALTVTSEHGPESTVLLGDGVSSAFRFVSQPAEEALIDGFTILHGGSEPAIVCEASSPTISNCMFKPDWAFGAYQPPIQLTASDARIRNCVLSGFTRPVIQSSGGAPVIEGCEISNNTVWMDGAILAYGSQLTLTGCRLRNNQSDRGSALQCFNSSTCTLLNCDLTSNCAHYFGGTPYTYGGAVYVGNGSSIVIADSVLAGNRSGGSTLGSSYQKGGAVFVHGGSARLTNCDLHGNAAAFGGAIGVQGGSLTVEDSTFTENAEHAVYAESGATVDLERSLFERNTAYYGGAVFGTGASFNIGQCEFRGNRAQARGGAMQITPSGSLTLRDSLFSANLAGMEGGAAYCLVQSASIVNCIFSGNTAPVQGAGLMLTGNGPTIISNCAFVGNRTPGGAGGLLFLGTGPLELVNSVLWGNTAQSGSQGALVWVNPANRLAYCVVQGGMGGFYSRNTLPPGVGIVSDDPAFARNGRWDDHGTPGDTSDDEWIEGDYMLTPDSSCIDAGDSTAVPAGVKSDLAGQRRFVDDPLRPDTGIPGKGRVVVDIGPYEFQGAGQ